MPDNSRVLCSRIFAAEAGRETFCWDYAVGNPRARLDMQKAEA